jgi:hypothetical protein
MKSATQRWANELRVVASASAGGGWLMLLTKALAHHFLFEKELHCHAFD